MVMDTFEIIAEPREHMGKSASRCLRHQGRIPGIVYGGGKDNAMITTSHNEIIHHLQHEAFHSHILTLKIGKVTEKVVLKALQHHPYKPTILHLDLQRVDETQRLTMRVPLHFINEANCVGVKRDGGLISHVMTDLEISCLPKDLPEYIEIDVENLGIGDGVHLNELNMPEGTEIAALLHGADAKQLVVSVHMPKVVEEPSSDVDELDVEDESSEDLTIDES